MTIFDYARMAAQAEKQVLELFSGALSGGLASESKKDLPDSARVRQGKKTSG